MVATGFPLELRHFALQIFILIELGLQESDRDLCLFLHTFRGEEIEIGALAFVVAKVVCYYQTCLYEGLQTIVDSPKTDPQLTGDLPLTCGWIVVEKLENAVSVFVRQHHRVFND